MRDTRGGRSPGSEMHGQFTTPAACDLPGLGDEAVVQVGSSMEWKQREWTRPPQTMPAMRLIS
jgi:hypothetical protein